jgi:hypothetical protein
VIQHIFPPSRSLIGTQKLLLVVVFALAVIFAFGACQSDADDDTEQRQANNAGQNDSFKAISDSDAFAARDTVLDYLSEQSWGFFGATCDKWVDLDYEFSTEDSGKTLNDAIVVVFNRRPDRDLGALALTFEVKPDGSVQGDNLLERSGIAEGCDQW